MELDLRYKVCNWVRDCKNEISETEFERRSKVCNWGNGLRIDTSFNCQLSLKVDIPSGE